MALTNCPECNHEISDKAKVCPNCGLPIKSELRKEAVSGAIGAVGEVAGKVKRKVPWKIVGIVFAAVAVVVVGGFFLFRDFWAKVFLDDDQYMAYLIHERHKDISGINGSCKEFYIDPLYENENFASYFHIYWTEEYKGVTIYCSGGTFSREDSYDVISGYLYTSTMAKEYEDSDVFKTMMDNANMGYDTAFLDNSFWNDDTNYGIELSTQKRLSDLMDSFSKSVIVTLPFIFK